jgi:X-Pro dipeptidyl-peptidase
MIFSSDRDFTLWPEAGTKLTVDLAGTSLELPVVGGQTALAEAVVPAPKSETQEVTPAGDPE